MTFGWGGGYRPFPLGADFQISSFVRDQHADTAAQQQLVAHTEKDTNRNREAPVEISRS